MNYKYSVLIIFFILFRFYAYPQTPSGPLEVKYVGFQIETIIGIIPTEFDYTFESGTYSFWDLDQHDTSSSLVYSYLTQFQIVKQKNINVRAEIIYSMNNVEQKKWMNKFGVFTDGKTCYKNENLFKFLKKKLDQ